MIIVNPKVTIVDVAREADVSAQTVSRVINNKGEVSPATRTLVQDVIGRLGYRPNSIARGLVTNRTSTFGLVVPDIANPFFPEIARGAEDTARARGYSIFLCNTGEVPEREVEVLQALEDKQVEGVILCSSRLPDERLLPRLSRHRAVVLVNRAIPGELAGTVRVEDAQGARMALEHLLANGCRVIGFLAGPPISHSARERLRGYREALEAAGRTVDPHLTVPCTPFSEGGYEAATQLLSARPELDALVCYNDLVAVGALRACADLGRRVPDDIAIVGCDDIPLAELVTPALTTLRVSKYDIGRAATLMLLERILGRTDQGEICLQPELIVRASTR